MLAKDLDKGLRVKDPSSEDSFYYIPPSQVSVLKAYEKVGQTYERSISDRVWDWFVNLITAEPVAKQEIKMSIPQLYRTKDPYRRTINMVT